MNQATTESLSNVRWFHKVCAYVLSVLMIVYPVAPTFASVVDNWMISDELNQNPYFIYADTTEHLYEATPFIDQPVSSSQNVESFYQSVLDQYREGLEPPTYVPIMVGDITTIIPIYKKYKYVGTPIVQERYIRSQIYQLLGRTLIDSEQSIYASETAQINTLYDNALTYLRSSADVTFGQRLALQVDNNGLSYNFVWPELRELNGQEVLVPIVYLSGGTVDDRRVTSNVNEINGDVTLEELIVENVSIQFGRDSFVQITKDLVNKRGAIEASGDLEIAVGGALQNLSGLISANNNLQIGAQSIANETIVYRYGDGYNESTGYSAIAEINATNGNILLRSYEDIIYQGSSSVAGGEITLAADGNIYIGTQTLYESTSNQRGTITTSDVSYLLSSLSAEKTIEFIAGSEILIEAADIVSSSGHITLLAAMGITIQDSLAATESKYQVGSTAEEAYKTVAMRSLLDAGMGITIHAEFGDINLKATELSTTQGTNVTASNGAVNLLVTKETDQYSYSSVRESLFTTTTINRGHDIETIVPTTIVGGFVANPLYGLNVEYEGNPDLSFDEQIDELAKMPGLEYLDAIRSDGSLDIDWFEIEARYEEWNESSTSLSAAAIAIISIAVAVATGGAGAGWTGAISNAAGGGALGAASSAAFVSIATATTIAASNALLNGEDPFEAAFQTVTDDDALKSAAIAAVTAGAIAAIDAEFFNTTQIGAENSTSGLVSASDVINPANGQALTDVAGNVIQSYSLSLTGQVIQGATHAAATAGIQSILTGAEFDEALVASLAQNAINIIGENLAKAIGDASKTDVNGSPAQISQITRYIAHAATGCLTGALSSEVDGGDNSAGCAAGAGGAVVGELIADTYIESNQELLDEVDAFLKNEAAYFEYLQSDEVGLTGGQALELLTYQKSSYLTQIDDLSAKGVDLARLGAGLTAFIAGADVSQINTAAESGANAAEHNALFIPAAIWLVSTIGYVLLLKEVNGLSREILDAGYDGNEELQKEKIIELAGVLGLEIALTVVGAKAGDLLVELIQKARAAGKNADEIAALEDLYAEVDVEHLQIVSAASDSAGDARYFGLYLNNITSPEIRSRLVGAAVDVRRELPPTEIGNVGFAEVSISAVSDELFLMKAFSGYDHRVDEFIPLPPGNLDTWILTPRVSTSRYLDTDQGYLRSSDTEFKILETISQSLGNNYSASGSINLFSERMVCPSCTNVIGEFREKFPNIQLNVFTGQQ